jgi:hypothetical protein
MSENIEVFDEKKPNGRSRPFLFKVEQIKLRTSRRKMMIAVRARTEDRMRQI